jgi:hypothetical protein
MAQGRLAPALFSVGHARESHSAKSSGLSRHHSSISSAHPISSGRSRKPLQPILRNIGSFLCMGQSLLELFNRGTACFRFRNGGPFLRQLSLELFSQIMACLELFLQNTDLLICFDTFRADTLGERQCVHPDPLRFILDTRHRPGCGAYHVERLKVLARLHRSLIKAGTSHGWDRLGGFGCVARNHRSLGSNDLDGYGPGCGIRRPSATSLARTASHSDYSWMNPGHPLIRRHLVGPQFVINFRRLNLIKC